MPRLKNERSGPTSKRLSALSDLTPDRRNKNAHTERGLGMLDHSLRTYGAGRSILVDRDGHVIAGNATLERAVELGLGVEVIKTRGDKLVVVQREDLDLNDPRARELALADNRVAEVDLKWDSAQLAAALQNGEDLSAFFLPEELTRLLGEPPKSGLTDPDAVPQERPTGIAAGDLFELGRHRLLCGDCTRPGDVARLMGEAAATFVLTDPPYGMDLDTDWSGAIGAIGAIGHGTKGNRYAKVVGDDKPFDPAPLFAAFGRARELFLFGADYYAERIPARGLGSWLVWDKRKTTQADAIGAEFELIWSKAKHKRRMLRHDWFGFLSSANSAEASDRVHPTQKPTSLLVDILTQWGTADDRVVDGYAGSGSTLLACEQTGRACYAVEIVPSYCQVIIDRFEAFTGTKAVKVGDAVLA